MTIYGKSTRLKKRLQLAWAFRVWPWNVPPTVLAFLEWPIVLRQVDIDRTREIAKTLGWL